MLTLYDAPRCPYCARTRIVLAEKGVPYDQVTIDLSDRPAWLLEHNPPHGRVPVLEEDGWILPESAVIDEYLDERFPEPPLLPTDPAERAAARLVVFRFDDLGDPYYAFRREEPGAEHVLAGSLAALDGLLAGDALPHRSCVRARRHRLSAVGASAPRPLRLPARSLRGDRAMARRCTERPSVAAEVDGRIARV